MTRWIITEKEAYTEYAPSKGRAAGYRVKEIRSGDRLELEIYPYWDTRPKAGIKARKLKESRAAQKNQNEKDSRKKFTRLLCSNFGRNDLHVTLTYETFDGQRLPALEEAMRDIRNYLARINRRREKAGLESAKYMYVVEGAKEEGERRTRIHAHLILEGGISRDEVESLWPFGYANADRLQPNDFGLEGLGRYLMKNPNGRRRWCASKNLKQPEVRIYDHKIRRRAIAEIENNKDSARDMVSRLYPEYWLHDPERDVQVRTNSFVSGAYVSMIMTKRQKC